MSLYTEEVKQAIYTIKPRLPEDFPLQTREEEYFIVICVSMAHFAHRPVEDRLAIAIELEKLRTLIEETGIRCVIEKE